MTNIKTTIQKKVTYYQNQMNEAITRFIKSNKRLDRDAVIIYRTKIQSFKEIIELV